MPAPLHHNSMDLRAEELATLKAIYDDTLFLSDESVEGSNSQNYCGKVQVPISLDAPITLSNASLSHQLLHLPPLELVFSLPPLYPFEACPEISVRSSILSSQAKSELETELCELWHDTKYQVLFAMVDHLYEKTAHPMDLFQETATAASPAGAGDVCPADSILLTSGPVQKRVTADPQLVDLLINNDKKRRKEIFDTSTFLCGICQENSFGSLSLRFPRCNHVFCMSCLSGFFVSLIEDANVDKVHCPDFDCAVEIAKERESQLGQKISSDLEFEDFKRRLMTPPILLDDLKRILEFGFQKNSKSAELKATDTSDSETHAARECYERYLALFVDHQHNLMAKLFPARVVTCAGATCTNMIFRRDVNELLVVCRKCGYAFCNNCRKSNHNKTRACTGVREKRQYFGISEEQLDIWAAPKTDENAAQKEVLRKTYGSDLLRKLALEYDMDKMDRLFSQLIADGDFSKCPTCDLVIQRSDGCNKMKCSACYSFFCNVCSAFLPPDTPYEHFNEKSSPCYGKLFHGMPGVDDT